MVAPYTGSLKLEAGSWKSMKKEFPYGLAPTFTLMFMPCFIGAKL
jgi:hypothetical protein